MRLGVSACLVSAALAMGLVVGCGGNVVVDKSAASGGQGGSGGFGGEGGSVFTTSTSPNTTVTSSSNVTTSVTSSSNVTTSVTSSSSAFVSSSSGSNGCDNSGDCGDQSGEGCINCSIEGGPCTDLYEICINGTVCTQYLDCISNCADPSCQDEYAETFPAGAQQYQDLIICALCVACPNDCEEFGQGCP